MLVTDCWRTLLITALCDHLHSYAASQACLSSERSVFYLPIVKIRKRLQEAELQVPSLVTEMITVPSLHHGIYVLELGHLHMEGEQEFRSWSLKQETLGIRHRRRAGSRSYCEAKLWCSSHGGGRESQQKAHGGNEVWHPWVTSNSMAATSLQDGITGISYSTQTYYDGQLLLGSHRRISIRGCLDQTELWACLGGGGYLGYVK